MPIVTPNPDGQSSKQTRPAESREGTKCERKIAIVQPVHFTRESNSCRDLESGDDEILVQNTSSRETSGDVTRTREHKPSVASPDPPPRLLVVSSKIRNWSILRGAVWPNVIFVQYKYISSGLDDIARDGGEFSAIQTIKRVTQAEPRQREEIDRALNGLIAQCLEARKVASVAFVLSCSGPNVLLCGKDEKVISKDSVQDGQPIGEFLTNILTNHVDRQYSNCRVDFLACSSAQFNECKQVGRVLETLFQLPVTLCRDIEGAGVALGTVQLPDGATKTAAVLGDLYFRLDKLRGWSGHYQQSLSGFEKIRTVGKGAYGAAVLYRKKDDDSLVILKEINMHDLSASERQLALNEVKVLAMLDHPNIISYYDSFEEDGILMIEMEYADGGTLSQYLSQRQDKIVGEREILFMFQQVVAAIRHIHEHSILHRDIKAANIFLTKEGVIKVGDFGISKMLSTSIKGANTVLGTPYYISPEMCEGKPYGEMSDIWALGCILYEMACLQKTFEGSNLPALVNKIMKGQFTPVNDNYTPEFRQLIQDMLSRDPSARPTANEILYNRLPQLMSKFEDPITDQEEECLSSAGKTRKKKLRSILYYLEIATLTISPVDLPPRIKIREVAVNVDHVLVVSMERQVYSWGVGSSGQLGHGDTEARSTPEIIDALRGKSICRVACGDNVSVFGSENGIVMTCGSGADGCLGHGDWCSITRPRLIEPLLSVDVTSIACGPRHVVAIGSAGEIFTWGRGGGGRLGLATDDDQCQPVEVSTSHLSAIAIEARCGIDGTMFLTDIGSVYACGNNDNNKLGLNTRQGFLMAMKNIFTKTEVEGTKILTPVRALGRHRVIDISMGPNHTVVVVEPGLVYTFGRNIEGQLGTGNTKTQNAPILVKTLENYIVTRAQSGEYHTISSTSSNELFFLGLRFKTPLAYTDAVFVDQSSAGSLGKDDTRVESMTPRNDANVVDVAAASRPTSPFTDGSNEKQKNHESYLNVPERQVSHDSVLPQSPGADNPNGLTTDASGFRPLSGANRRNASASSLKETGKDKDWFKEDAVLFLQPTHILKLVEEEEIVNLASFHCHGENLFVQVDTTAPPARRKSRKKRSFRRRFPRDKLAVPDNYGCSTSSREGGDEYSSETSEIDTLGTIPSWLKEELVSAAATNDGNEAADDMSDASGDDGRKFDASLPSIRLNAGFTTGKSEDVTPRQPENSVDDQQVECSVDNEEPTTSGRARVNFLYLNDAGMPTIRNISSSSSNDVPVQRTGEMRIRGISLPQKQSTHKIAAPVYKSKSPSVSSGPAQRPLNRLRAQNRARTLPPSQEMALKERLSARGFVSDVTVKRREETLQNELEKIKLEKQEAEERLANLQKKTVEQAVNTGDEASGNTINREKRLQDEIEVLRAELHEQNNKLRDNQKVLSTLQEQLSRVQTSQTGSKVKGESSVRSSKDSGLSKVCQIQ